MKEKIEKALSWRFVLFLEMCLNDAMQNKNHNPLTEFEHILSN